MAVRKKVFIPGRVYFITFTIFRWQRVFITKQYCDLVFKWFDYQREQYQNRIHGYVIMPNHLHCLIYISEASPPVSKLVQNAKRFLAYGIVPLLEEEGKDKMLAIFKSVARTANGAKHKVFEERYDSKIIENAALFREKLEYIHNNPCKGHWRLAEAPEKYPFSSASNYHAGNGMYEVEVIR